MIALSLSFFVTAVLYASVGFGGGSTYNALLVLSEVDYRILPSIALFCNIIVVSGGTWRFAKKGHIKFKRILPWVVTSIPAAWIGGMVEISETVFVGLLGSVLFLSGLRMLWPNGGDVGHSKMKISPLIAPVIGTVLGFVAGLVGVGGGIFLAPILHLLRWGNAKSIAGTCSIFIFLNSISGLVGQMMKAESATLLSELSFYWMLFPAVFIGGQIGSYLGATRLQPKTVCRMTAVLILYVSVRLLWRWLSL